MKGRVAEAGGEEVSGGERGRGRDGAFEARARRSRTCIYLLTCERCWGCEEIEG